MSRLPLYSNVSRWVFSGGHRTPQKEQEYGYTNYLQDWSTTYLRPNPPSFSRYDRVAGYYSIPFGYSDYPGYMHVNAYNPEAVYYTGRTQGHKYAGHHYHERNYEQDRGYEKPITAREREMQNRNGKQKHPTEGQHSKIKKNKAKSNKKIQMYRSRNLLEPPLTSESSYPLYMFPKRRMSYQNYMQESSFYGDDDDATLESESQGQDYHHRQYDPGLYRLRRVRHSSSSTHTSYENHGVGSDIEEENFDTHFDEEQDNKANAAAETTEKVVYANTQTQRNSEDEATQTLTVADNQYFTKKLDRNDDGKQHEYENTQTTQLTYLKTSEPGAYGSSQSVKHSNENTSGKNEYINTQTSMKMSTEGAEKVLYENTETLKHEDENSFQVNAYENTRNANSEKQSKKNIYEDVQTPIDQDFQSSWTNVYDNINPTDLVKTETHQRTEYQYIHPTNEVHYKVTDLRNLENEGFNRKEFSELEIHERNGTVDSSEFESAYKADEGTTNKREYSEYDSESISRKEYSELENVTQHVDRDFGRISEGKLAHTLGCMGYEVGADLDNLSQSDNVRNYFL